MEQGTMMAEGTGGEIMAEFTEIWKNWKRMCQHQRDLNEGSCMDCPLGKLECNREYPKDQIHYDGKAIEEIIVKWAAEHPEPVYPTWWRWLIDEGYIEKGSTYTGAFDQLKTKSIPADIAEKLGVEPKEDT